MASSLDRPLPPGSRWAVLALIAGLGAASWHGWNRWHTTRDGMLGLLEETGLGTPVLDQRIRYERNPEYAKLDVARAIVHDALDRTRLEALEPAQLEAAVARRIERLPIARDLAGQVLDYTPASWEAPMFVGTSTYLEWALSRDPRLFSEADRWQEPLLYAYQWASGKREPRMFLLTVYLELWPALSDARRELSKELLARSFRDDPGSWPRLGDLWLSRAETVEEAFSVLPDRPQIWAQLEHSYAAHSRWGAFLQARERRIEAATAEVARLVRRAERQLALKDPLAARASFEQAILALPVDGRFAPTLEQIVAAVAPGLGSAELQQRLGEWLHWEVELYALGRPRLSPEVLNRIAAATERPALPEDALAALAGGELYRAEHMERRAESVALGEWAPYLVAKARELLDRGEVEGALAALDAVVPHARDGFLYWRVRRRAAEATGNLAALEEAEAALRSAARESWSSGDWTWPRPGLATLRLLPGHAATGLLVEISRAPVDGGVVRVTVDGSEAWVGRVRSDQELEIEVVLDSEPHLVAFETVAGERVFPGPMRLIDRAGEAS